MIENQLQQNILANLTHGKSVAFAVRCIARFLIFVLVFVSAFHTLPQPKIDLQTGEIAFEPAVQKAHAATNKTVFITSGTSWTVPSDWNSASNTIEVIGGGGGGARGASGSPWGPGSGGGGGGYAKVSNVTLTPNSSVTVAVGSAGTGAASASSNGGDGGDTYICRSTSNCASLAGTGVVAGAEGGAGGVFSSASDPAGGAGGSSANASGTVTYSGGTGGAGVVSLYNGGGGGGGAAGPNGAGGTGGAGEGNGTDASGGGGGGADGGSNGTDASYQTAGTGGDSGTVGSSGGAASTNGSSGGGGGGGVGGGGAAGNGGDGDTLWTQTSDSATAGPGGGGGSPGDGASGGGGAGGTYGGGGGGTSESAGAAAGSGGQGIIVVTYTTADVPDTVPPTPSTMSFSSAPAPVSASSISMTSVTATDASSSVEYNFLADTADCSSDYGTTNDSGWQSSASYTDTSLSPNKCYGYKVVARDTSDNRNSTSTASSTYTYANVPGAVSFSGISSTSVTISNAANSNPSSNPTTNFAIYVTSADSGWNHKYVTSGGGASASPVWLTDAQIDGLALTGLTPEVSYTFVSVAKNADGILTASSTGALVTAVDAVDPVNWNTNDWTLYDSITINAANIDSTLTDFPVYVDLSDLSTQFWTTTPSAADIVGTDIRVTNASNQELPRELVFASSTAQTGELHFKADTISSSADTEFRIWYNGSINGDYTATSTYGAQNVWTNEYIAVWHMNDDPTGTIYDSTSYDRDGTSSGSMTSSDVVSGAVGNAINFDGNDAIDTGTLESMTIDAVSIEAWARPTTIAGVSWRELAYADGTVGLRMLGSGARYSLAASHSTLYGDWWSPASSAVEGDFQYIYSGRADMTNNSSDAVFYIDGVSQSVTEDSTPSGTYVQPNGQTFDLGTSFIGDLDEIRIASTTRSAAWISAQYLNQSTTTDFYTAAAIDTSENVQVWNTSLWTTYDTITIDASHIDANLTDFPVYVDLSDLSATFWSTTPQSASLVGTDIRVTNASNQELPRELVFASVSTQTGELHFKADFVSSSTDTTFKIWYNGSTAGDYPATATYGSENVWDNDYIAVYHMQEDPTATVLDSTSNSLDSVGYGSAMGSDDLVAGKLGGNSINFDDNQYTFINFGSPALVDNLGTNSDVTFSTWYNHTDYGPTYNLDTKFWSKSAGGTGNGPRLSVHNDAITCFDTCNNGFSFYSYKRGERAMEYNPSSGWDYLVTTWDGTDSYTGIGVYVDGVTAASYELERDNGADYDDSTNNMWLGNYGNVSGTEGYYPTNGQLDEFRISSTSRSAEWIAAEYVNQAEPNIFYTTSTAQRVETVSYTAATTGTSWEVPAGVTEVTIYTWGAGGGGGAGGGDSTSSNGGLGGGGGFMQGTVSVTPAETLTVKVGGGGGGGDWATDDGGGSAGAGGYSGVFRSTTPLVMAGGGGGGGGGSQDNVTDPSGGDGGAGGGLVGITGGHATSTSVTGGTGGTQSAGGSAGTGGDSNGEAGETDGRYEGGDGVQSSNTGLGAAGAAGTNGGGAGAIGSSANRNASGAGGGGYYGGGSGGSGAAGGGGGGGGSSYAISSATGTSTAAGGDRGVGNGSHPYRIGTAGQGGWPGIGGTTEAEGDGGTGDDGQVVITYVVPSGTAWNDTDWTEYDTITVRREAIDESLTDFPVYVDLSDLSANFWSTVSDGGGDIRVTTDATVPSEVPREVVFASTTAQTGELHFKAPYLSDVVDTSFRIYYNGSDIDYDTDQAYGAENVWTNDYVAVWHLQEEGNSSTDGYIDSTSNKNHGTGVSLTTAADVSGKLGNAQSLDGTADYFEFPDTSFVGTFTFDAWALRDSSANTDVIFGEDSGTSGSTPKVGYDSTNVFARVVSSSDTSVSAPSNAEWHKYTVSRDGSSKVDYYNDGGIANRLFSNAAQSGTYVLDTIAVNGSDFTDHFGGDLDEVRISSSARSAAWVGAEYQNQATTTGFYTLSNVQASGLGDTNVIIITDTSSTTWAVPSDWNSDNNTIEVIGGGGGGGEGSGSIIGSGGGGGAYSKSANVTLTPGGSVAMQIGGGGAVTTAGDDTYICSSTSNCASIAGTAVVAGAKGGGAGVAGNDIDGGAGGASASGYAEADGVEDAAGSQKYSGGNGGHAGWNGGSGGGGGAGPNGAGANGGNATSWGGGGGGGNGGGSVGSNSSSAVGADGGDNVSATGGGTGGNTANGTAGSSGGGGGGGADNYSGGDGGSGVEWTTAGSGGGGGGAGSGGGGGDGGLYGAGGGGESDFGAGAGVGAQGVIVITYTPVATASIGSSTISNSDAGQVDNAFNGLNQTNTPLFSFKITPDSGSMTVNRIEFELAGINTKKLDLDNFTNIRLYQDDDNDAAYDAGDTQVGGSGTITPWTKNKQYAYLTFESDFSLSTAKNYVVVADWDAPDRGSHMKIDLKPKGLDVSDSNGPVIVDGSVSHVNHSRNSSGGGGGAVGGDAPSGDAEESGGVEGSGEEGGDSGGAIDTNTSGDTIGNEVDYFWPTANGSVTWTNPSYAYDTVDGTYATANSALTQVFTTFNDSVPGTDTVEGISVKLEVSGTTAAGTIDVELSWDNGSSWTTAKTSPTLTTSDTVITLGGSGDNWGHSWTPAQISSFQLRVTANPSSNTVQIDGIQAKIHHQSSGGSVGGGGGGGAI